MSVSAISSSTIAASTAPSVQNNLRQFQQEFLQLGSDLQSGNLTAAQQDYASLHAVAGGPGGAGSSSGPATPGSNPLLEQLNQLGSDLGSGNLAAAQQQYGGLKQDFQRIDHLHNNLRAHIQGFGGDVEGGPAAAPGSLATAQAAYNTLLEGLQEFGSEQLTPSLLPSLDSSGVSISA